MWTIILIGLAAVMFVFVIAGGLFHLSLNLLGAGLNIFGGLLIVALVFFLVRKVMEQE